MSTFRTVQIDSLRESPTNPRKTFDPDKLLELSESIAQKGLLSPLLVRPIDDLCPFEIVAGARRFRAAKLAGLAEVPVVIRELSDKEALELQLVENAQREDVSPLEEAEGYACLVENHGHTYKSLALATGHSVQHIAQRCKLLELSNNARAALQNGVIKIGHANELARLRFEHQDQILNRFNLDNGEESDFAPTIDELKGYIGRCLMRPLNNAPFSLQEKYLAAGAPACTECPRNAALQQELFQDLAGTATCTDVACYETKVQQHVKLKLIQIREENPQAIAISQSWKGNKDLLAIPTDAYRQTQPDEPNAIPALAVDGDHAGRMVYVVLRDNAKGWLKNAEKPEKPVEEKPAGKSWQQQQEEENQRRLATAKFRSRLRALLTEEIKAKVPRVCSLEHLKVLLSDQRLHLEANARRTFAELAGIDEKTVAKGIPAKLFDDAPDLDSFTWLNISLELAGDVIASPYSPANLTEMQQTLATLHGIDLAALSKQAKAALKAEEKPAKPAPKKTAAKKTAAKKTPAKKVAAKKAKGK